MCSVALITYGSTQRSDGGRQLGIVAEDARTPRGQFITPFGQLSPIGYYAMVAQLHMHRYGTKPEALAEVAVAARQWAMLNHCRAATATRSEEHTSELQSRGHLVCRLLLEKKKNATLTQTRPHVNNRCGEA